MFFVRNYPFPLNALNTLRIPFILPMNSVRPLSAEMVEILMVSARENV